MSQATTVLVVIALILVGGFVAVFYWLAPQSDAHIETDSAAQLAAMVDRMDEMDSRQRRIEDALLRLENRPTATGGLSPDDVRSVVDDVIAEAPDAIAKPVVPGEDDLVEETIRIDIAASLKKLEDPNLSFEDRQKLWSDLVAAGVIDDAIALLQKRSEAQPGNPEAHTDLGEAYIQKLTSGKLSYQETGDCAIKADAAYDKALGVNDEHWRARFNKAASLAWWPPQLGKQGEAVKQFQLLIDQQGRQQKHPGHVQAHLMLGNVYQQMGQHDKAVGAWEAGLAQFPDDASLRAQVENSRR